MPVSEAPPESATRRPLLRPFFDLASGFWIGTTRRTAWLLTGGVLLFVVLNLAAAICINRWNKFFFDALERKDFDAFIVGIAIILGLVIFSAAAAVALIHIRMRLQLRWREWLTAELTRRWLAERRFYQLNLVGAGAENPEFRIADDARLAIEPLVDFAIGLTNAVLAAIAFAGILWTAGGSITLFGWTIPGYMVIAAIIYSSLISAGMVLIGRPLVAAVEEKNGGEAKLRYELTRVREQAESIALIGGDDDERARINKTFGELARQWINVITRHARMGWVLNANMVLGPVIPLLLGAPKYLSGELTLGTLMQAAAAFVQVQIALNWLVDNSIRLAEWFASARRVIGLTQAIEDLEDTLDGPEGESVDLGWSPDDAIHLKSLSIRQAGGGNSMIDDADAVIHRGDKVLVKGESGSGKSTLIRAMAGLWPWGSGAVLRPEGAKIAFLPQRPYMPLGTLRNVLLYPNTEREVDDGEIETALKRTGLSHLFARLDEEDQWASVLSGGEQQRVAFVRLLLDAPDVVIMDEATSALDELSQERMMELMHTDLSATTVISVGHRPSLEQYHSREITLTRKGGGAAVMDHRTYPKLRQIMKRVIKPSKAARARAKANF